MEEKLILRLTFNLYLALCGFGTVQTWNIAVFKGILSSISTIITKKQI